MTPSDLLTFIYKNTDEDVIKLFKKNPELIRLGFTFVCLYKYRSEKEKSVCSCCQKLETFNSKDPVDSLVTELCCYLDRGYCKCLQEMQMAKSEQEDHSEYRPMYKDWNKENARTSVLHIASALGKKKLVKFIFPKMTYKLYDFYTTDYATGSLKLTPLHVAFINNRMDIFKLLIKRCVYFLCVNSFFIDDVSETGYSSYELCITSIAGSNAIDYLNCIISRSKRSFVNHKIDARSNEKIVLALCKALHQKSYECASLLADNVRNFSIPWRKECKKAADFVLDSDDDRLFTILMSIRSLNSSYCLQRLITIGNKTFIAKLIQITRKYKKDLQGEPVPFLTQAVVSDSSLDIIKILLAHCQEDNFRFYHGYSALDWASLLGYKEMEKVVRQSGIEESNDRSSPPLHAIFDFENIEFDLCKSVNRLIVGGHDVNAESTNGITPFVKAIELQYNGYINGYLTIRTLLQNGAEPFRGIGCTIPVDRQLLVEFLYCNVDIYNTNYETSLFKHLLITQQYEHLFLFLRCANTLLQSYIKALSSLHVHVLTTDCNGWGLRLKTEIQELLDKPQSLLIFCRNRLRRFYGINIHSFVNTCNLPSSIKKLLLLENELPYRVGLD